MKKLSKRTKTGLIIALVFAVILSINLVIQRNDRIEEQKKQEERVESNKKYLKDKTAILKQIKPLNRNIVFSNIKLKDGKVNVFYDIKSSTKIDKSFLDDIVNIVVLHADECFDSSYEADASYFNFIFKVDNYSITSNLQSHNFYNGNVNYRVVYQNTSSTNNDVEKLINTINTSIRNEFISKCDGIINTLQTYAGKISVEIQAKDVENLPIVIKKAQSYELTAQDIINSMKDSPGYEENYIEKLNATQEVLNRFDSMINKIIKVIETNKDGFISLESYVDLYNKSIEKYNSIH